MKVIILRNMGFGSEYAEALPRVKSFIEKWNADNSDKCSILNEHEYYATHPYEVMWQIDINMPNKEGYNRYDFQKKLYFKEMSGTQYKEFYDSLMGETRSYSLGYSRVRYYENGLVEELV